MAEAVSLRKGSHNDHENFTGGIKGEVTYDTSEGHKSLWTHDGDGSIGTELARADFENCVVHNLGTHFDNENLAFANLSNLTPITNTQVVENALAPLHYTNKTYVDTQIDTRMDRNLSNITQQGETNLATLVGQNFVKKDLSNFNTAIAGGTTAGLPSGSKPLAYTDMSNINTADLATGRSGTSGDDNLLYADLSNIETIASSSNVHTAGIQTTDQLVDVDSASTMTEYPTALSVKTRLDNIISLPQMNSVESKKQVYTTYNYGWKYTLQVASGGQDYAQGDLVHIQTTTTQGTTVTLQAAVEEVDPDNNNALVDLLPLSDYGQEEITQNNVLVITDTGSGQSARVDITSTNEGQGGLNWSTLTGLLSEDVSFNNLIPGGSGSKYIEERDETIENVKTALETLGLNQQDINSITEVMVTDITGVITVHTKRSITSSPTAKALIGGTTLVGSWSGSGTTWNFTPNDPNDTLANSWIVVL